MSETETEKKPFGYTITVSDEGRWGVMVGDPSNGGWYVFGFTSEEAIGGWILEFIERNHIANVRLTEEARVRNELLEVQKQTAAAEMLARLLEPKTVQ